MRGPTDSELTLSASHIRYDINLPFLLQAKIPIRNYHHSVISFFGSSLLRLNANVHVQILCRNTFWRLNNMAASPLLNLNPKWMALPVFMCFAFPRGLFFASWLRKSFSRIHIYLALRLGTVFTVGFPGVLFYSLTACNFLYAIPSHYVRTNV